MKYLVTKANFVTHEGTELFKRTFQVEGETPADALKAANQKRDKIAIEESDALGVHIEYSYTGDFVEANLKIVGGNGMVVAPLTEFEANETLKELIEQFPETRFEVKEVKQHEMV